MSASSGDAELRRRDGEIDRARFGARVAQRRAAILDRQAARGHAPRRDCVGVAAARMRTRVERDIELFRRDLRQRGQDALAELDLAG